MSITVTRVRPSKAQVTTRTVGLVGRKTGLRIANSKPRPTNNSAKEIESFMVWCYGMTKVWVGPSSRRRWRSDKTYHTDETCVRIPDDANKKDLNMLNDDWSECDYCSGEFEGPTEQDHSYQDLEGLWDNDDN